MTSSYIRNIVRMALAEDIGKVDITTHHLIPAHWKAKAHLTAKSDGVICGVEIARQVFKTLNPRISFRVLKPDAQLVKKRDIIALISGPASAMLTGERVAINMLSFLSGIATVTRQFVDKIKPYKAVIMDTRKTTPLLRHLERYAVRCGDGFNHRFNLNDMAMIKDNHRMACRGLPLIKVINGLKSKVRTKLEVEVDNFDELKLALTSKADMILLDNMTPRQVAQAVRWRNKMKSLILLEASGGITIHNVRQYAATGVERISVGALTHSRKTLDISLDFTFNK